MSWLLAALPLLVVALVAAKVHRFGHRPPRFPARALPAVILGARVYDDGTPSDALRDRVQTGVALLRAGHASRLVMTGGSVGERATEAEVMLALAKAAGVDAALVQVETKSRSTFENAKFCAGLLTEREVLVVTCDFHLARASAHFRTRGFVVWPVPSPRALRPVDRWRNTLKEAAALLSKPRLLWALRTSRSV